jgi:hypothetical protein
MSTGHDHPQPTKEQMGWGPVDEPVTIAERLLVEKREKERLANDYPILFKAKEPRVAVNPAMLKAYEDFVESKGYDRSTRCLILVSEFVLKKVWNFLPQLTGSCVWSNTFRMIVDRICYEIGMKGDAEVPFGDAEFGVRSMAPHMISYGWARQRANMRSGDGLYCSPMIESMAKDGFVMCSNPEIQKIYQELNIDSPKNYPEPQPTSVYRKFQNWAYNERLRKYGDYQLLESTTPGHTDDILKSADEFIGYFQCSGIAVKKKAKDEDGRWMHTLDPNNSWAHNMGIAGKRVTSKTKRVYVVVSNRSWIYPGNNPDDYIYLIDAEEYQSKWFRQVDLGSCGEMSLPPAALPAA